MRFLSLNMQRYGPFEDKKWDFAQEGAGGLHLIYGPNGAGKSTTLRALRAVLFGISRGTDTQRFVSKDLRIGAHLQRSTGEEVEYLRRTASKSPLWLPSDDEVLPEEQLSPFLGGLDRERFESIYGLDLETMQAGGKDLVKGEGDIGKALFGAALGGTRLTSILNRIQSEASDLYADNSSKPSINQHLADLKDLAKERKRHSLTASDYKRSRKAWKNSQDDIDKLKKQRSEIQKACRDIEQKLKLLSPLRRLENARTELEGFDVQQPIAANDIQAFETLQEEHKAETTELNRLEKAQKSRVQSIALLKAKANSELLASEVAVRALQGELSAYKQALEDLPELRDECDAARGKASFTSTAPMAVENPEQALQILGSLSRERRSARMELENTRAEVSRASLELVQAQTQQAKVDVQFETESRAQIEQLAPFSGTLAELAEVVPPTDIVISDRLALEKKRSLVLAKQESDQSNLQSRERNAQTQLQGLEGDAQGMPPTNDELLAARKFRDSHWRSLSEDLAAGNTPNPVPELAASIFEADRVVDRLREDGERAVLRMSLEKELGEVERRRAELNEQHARETDSIQSEDQAWLAAWKASGLVPLEAQAMGDWTALRTKLLHELGQSRSRAQEDTQKLDLHLQERSAAQAASLAKVEAIEGRWREWAQRTGFDPEITEEIASADLNALLSSSAAAKTLARLGPRLKALQDQTGNFEEQARLLAQQSNIARVLISETVTEQALEREAALGKALREATRIDVDLIQKVKDQELDQGYMAHTTERIFELTGKLAELRSKYGSENEAAFQERVNKAGRLASLLQEQTQILDELATAAPGESIEDLLTQFQGDDLEGLTQPLEDKRAAEQELSASINEHHENLGNLKRDVEGEGSEEAAKIETQSAAIMAAVAEETERYVRLEMARFLLDREIEQHRLLHQGPLLERAGVLFETLTLGAYTRLVPSEEKGKPVMVALRPGGQQVGIEGMSSGTQDQLYLALRIASVEQMIRTTEPMPFIADDLFVNFDDKRTEAALKVLFELSKTTQVIVFSHHDSVLASAKFLAAKDIPIQVHNLLSESARETQTSAVGSKQ